jgi:uncharacterized protein YxeA
MTFINWISIGITAVLLAVCIGVKLYYRKKLRELDGFMGFIQAERETVSDDTPDPNSLTTSEHT